MAMMLFPHIRIRTMVEQQHIENSQFDTSINEDAANGRSAKIRLKNNTVESRESNKYQSLTDLFDELDRAAFKRVLQQRDDLKNAIELNESSGR